MRKKVDAIQSNPRVFATLILTCPSGYYVYRLLSGVDGLTVQVSRVYPTKQEAANNMFIGESDWADVQDQSIPAGAQRASKVAAPTAVIASNRPVIHPAPSPNPGYIPQGRRPRQQSAPYPANTGRVLPPQTVPGQPLPNVNSVDPSSGRWACETV